MNLTKNTILALGLLVAAGAGHAQEAMSTGATPAGVLGQSYTELKFSMADLDSTSHNLYGAGVAANVPVTPGLDLGAGYTYGWIRGSNRGHLHSVGTTATAYTAVGGVKPFVGVGLEYQWTRLTGNRNDATNWTAAAGVEIPAGVLTVTPRVVYTDDFRGTARSTQQLSYEVEGNVWLNRRAAIFATAGYTDVRHTNVDSWDYGIGIRFKL